MERSTMTGRDVQRMGQIAEERFAQRVLHVLYTAFPEEQFHLINTPKLDGAEKVDLRVIYTEPGTGYQVLNDFQVSMTAKSTKRQELLQRRGVIPVVVNPDPEAMPDEELDAMICTHIFPKGVPERYARYAGLN